MQEQYFYISVIAIIGILALTVSLVLIAQLARDDKEGNIPKVLRAFGDFLEKIIAAIANLWR